MSQFLGVSGCLRQKADTVDARVGLRGLKQNADSADFGRGG